MKLYLNSSRNPQSINQQTAQFPLIYSSQPYCTGTYPALDRSSMKSSHSNSFNPVSSLSLVIFYYSSHTFNNSLLPPCPPPPSSGSFFVFPATFKFGTNIFLSDGCLLPEWGPGARAGSIESATPGERFCWLSLTRAVLGFTSLAGVEFQTSGTAGLCRTD